MEKFKLLKDDEIEIIKRKDIKKILLIGGSDTGKTTLIMDIANILIKGKNKVFIIDSDVGQSHIGPPTTIGIAEIKNGVSNISKIKEDEIYFVGSITPSGNILGMITGIKKMSNYRWKGKLLIDTTGYINDPLAIYLKIHKIEILKPDLVILLEKGNELELIKKFIKFSSVNLINIKVPEIIPSKSMEERANYRKRKFIEYFKNSREEKIEFDNLSIKIIGFRYIKQLEEIFSLNLKGALVSFFDKEFKDISLGLILDKNEKCLKIATPLRNFSEIKGITISNFFLNPEEVLI